MSEAGSFAFITGGASGIGRALTIHLVGEGAKVFVVDRDAQRLDDLAAETIRDHQVVWTAQADVMDWDQQASAFRKAVDTFGRLDYVFPIAGISERRTFPNRGQSQRSYEKPDLSVLDVNLTAVLYTVSLGLQQFRQQGVNKFGFKGKIGCVSSIAGLYAPMSLPIYATTKHGIVGFVRGFGKYLPREQITMNAVCPAVVRTGMTDVFSNQMEDLGLLTPMSTVIEAFRRMLGDSIISGECFESGPRGCEISTALDYSSDEIGRLMGMISEKSLSLHEPTT